MLLKDLIPIEEGLVFGDAIGLVEDHPFSFKVNDPTPIK
jgi:hypothetical protein